MHVSTEEEDSVDVVGHDLVHHVVPFLFVLAEYFVIGAIAEYLVAADDDVEGTGLVSHVALVVAEVVDEPVHLLFAEMLFGTSEWFRVDVFKSPVGSVVEKVKINVAPVEIEERARQLGHAVGEVSPKQFKGFRGGGFVEKLLPGVIGAVIVVVPNGVLVGAGQESAHVGEGAGVVVAMENAGAGGPIRFPQVDVVPQPEHQIRLFFVNGFEDFVVAPKEGHIAPTVAFCGDEDATAQCHGEIRRLVSGRVAPSFFSLEAQGNGSFPSGSLPGKPVPPPCHR